MNIETISMDRIAAREAFQHYRAAVKERRSKEDEALMHGYRALAKGKQLLDLHGVMRAAGVDAQFRPRLAICRADARQCIYVPRARQFWADEEGYGSHTRRYVGLPEDTYPDSPHGRSTTLRPDGGPNYGRLSALVPLIPPQYRPTGSLAAYHLLWEPAWEPAPPVDPLLLRHLHGSLYAVLAQWDLTPLERAVLRGRLG